MKIVIVGHVDHGKSTVIGRLLADTGSLPEGKLEQVRAHCERNARPFEYAFLLDALKDEQAQGITIDAASIFFRTEKRRYVIIDAPGHVEFVKNMVTGAAKAEAALLVIDAKEGIQENSRRHGMLLSFLGVRQLIVLVNKLDLVGYDEGAFERVRKEYGEFLRGLGVEARAFIPVAGLHGENIAARSPQMAWYAGPTVLTALDSFSETGEAVDLPLRIPVQDVYKFTADGDDRRIVAGSVVSGRLRVGDPVVFYPSGKRARVKSIERFGASEPPTEARAGLASGFTLTEQIYVTRGEVVAHADSAGPQVANRFRTNLFWLGREALPLGKKVVLKLGSARVGATLEKIERVMDSSSLSARAGAREVARHEIADCVLRMDRPIAFDVDGAELSRFVLVDGYEISGGGLIQSVVEGKEQEAIVQALRRDLKWEPSAVSPGERAKRHGHEARLIIVTGPAGASENRKAIARALERELFGAGLNAYFLGIANVLHGLDADLRGRSSWDEEVHQEHLRRVAEALHLLLDSGLIVVLTAQNLTRRDCELIRAANPGKKVDVVWAGGELESDVEPDYRVDLGADARAAALGALKALGIRG